MQSGSEKHVYFVRHGESDSNADGVFRGNKAALTDKGQQQATVVAERIQRIGVDALISSTWIRARQTADAIAERTSLPIEESDLFVERRRPSAMLGRRYKDPEVIAIMHSVFEGDLTPGHRHSDEENVDDLRERANAALSFLMDHTASRICVVTHGNFLAALFSAALNPAFSGSEFRNAIDGIHMSNTGISYLRYEVPFLGEHNERRWRIVSWNDSAHLG